MSKAKDFSSSSVAIIDQHESQVRDLIMKDLAGDGHVFSQLSQLVTTDGKLEEFVCHFNLISPRAQDIVRRIVNIGIRRHLIGLVEMFPEEEVQ